MDFSRNPTACKYIRMNIVQGYITTITSFSVILSDFSLDLGFVGRTASLKLLPAYERLEQSKRH